MSEADKEYGCIRPFDIDHGQLDGFKPNEVFVLGYECALIDDLLKLPESFHRVVHSANRERIQAQVEQLGRESKWRWTADDSSETWIYLDVAPKGGA